MAYPYYYQQPFPYGQYQEQQNQNNGFVSAPNEYFARNYPVALGKSVTFKDESAPYIYTKTMGFSQLETPRFEKYKLVKEDPESTTSEVLPQETDKLSSYALKTDLEPIWEAIKSLQEKPTKKKKGESENE